jgi:hypothetical protein
MSGVRKEFHGDYTSSSIRDRIPVLDTNTSAPIMGSIAIRTPSIVPHYADGTQWLPFGGGAGVLESGVLGLTPGAGLNALSDGNFNKVLFDQDQSPLTPAHPSITVDVPNSQFVINTAGNYIIYYSLNPCAIYLSNNDTAPQICCAEMQLSNPAKVIAYGRNDGSFSFQEGSLSPPFAAPNEPLAKVHLQGSWCGTLNQGCTVQLLFKSANTTNQDTILSAEGDSPFCYMYIVRIA